jgi:hypothetical protein
MLLDSPGGVVGDIETGSLHDYVPTDVQLQLPWHSINKGHGDYAAIRQ